MVKNHFSMKQIKGGAAAPRSSSGKKKSDRSTRPSTTHLTEIRQFRDWINIVNKIITILLSERKTPLILPFEFIKMNTIPSFGIEVTIDKILFTDENIELYVSKTKELFLNPGFPSDKIFEKYYTGEFSDMKINKEELFRHGYLLFYHERGGGKRLHEEYGALIAQAINTTNSVFQWSETNTGGINNVGILSTDKDVHTDGIMKCVSLQQTSDIRLKNNIAPLNKKVHLDKLQKLIPKSYNFQNNNKTSFGFIAQEVEKIYPNLVETDNKGIKSLNYSQLIPLLLLQSNELERKIEELKNNN